MKKLLVLAAVSAVLLVFGPGRSTPAGQNEAPPFLMQESPAPPSPPGPVPVTEPPPAPTSPAVPPGPPAAPTAPAPRIAAAETVPLSTLLADLPKAVDTVQKLAGRLTPGKVWIVRAPGGETEIKAGLLYQGVVVAVLRFSPMDGSVLPLGVRPRVYQNSVSIQTVKARLSSVMRSLKILPAAEFMEPEASWSFPVAMGEAVVTHLKVYYDGIHIVQDTAANQEMNFYGR